jgi:hypothetical protein
MLAWLRRLLSAGRAGEGGAQAASSRDGGAIRIDAERIDAARQRLREEIPPPTDDEDD